MKEGELLQVSLVNCSASREEGGIGREKHTVAGGGEKNRGARSQQSTKLHGIPLNPPVWILLCKELQAADINTKLGIYGNSM